MTETVLNDPWPDRTPPPRLPELHGRSSLLQVVCSGRLPTQERTSKRLRVRPNPERGSSALKGGACTRRRFLAPLLALEVLLAVAIGARRNWESRVDLTKLGKVGSRHAKSSPTHTHTTIKWDVVQTGALSSGFGQTSRTPSRLLGAPYIWRAPFREDLSKDTRFVWAGVSALPEREASAQVKAG